MDVYQNIQDGKYENKLPFPERVKEPAILRKTARELTPAEVKIVPAVRKRYEVDKAQYAKLRDAYSQETQRLERLLKSDLEESNGVTDNPKADALWHLIWNHFHGHGYTDIYSYYDEFVELIK